MNYQQKKNKRLKMLKKLSNKNLIFSFLGGLLLYLVSAGISYAVFHYLATSPLISTDSSQTSLKSGFRVDLSSPKTEVCPLNGAMFTKEERKIWEERRPIAAMIENHVDARPQSGLSRADVIYEAVAEGGITRFLALFYCDAVREDVKIAPMRSSRIYFIHWAEEYGKNPLYVHVGGSNDFSGSGDTAREARALEYLQEIKWRYRGGNDLDPTFDGQFPVFWRDYERLGRPIATEHTMVSSTEKIWEEAHKRGLDNFEGFIPWKFKDEASLEKRQETANIQVSFWSGYNDYDVRWEYNKENNYYLRFNGGEPHKDHNNGEHLKAKVVVVQFAKEKGPVDRNKHLVYVTEGEGRALVFQDGGVIEGIWKKEDSSARTNFFDTKRNQIVFNRGLIWIEVVPAGKEVGY